MRLLTASLLAIGGLAAPAAIGQSQGVIPGPMPAFAFDQLLAGAGAPDPAVAWLMALGFLGVVVLRRIRPL